MTTGILPRNEEERILLHALANMPAQVRVSLLTGIMNLDVGGEFDNLHTQVRDLYQQETLGDLREGELAVNHHRYLTIVRVVATLQRLAWDWHPDVDDNMFGVKARGSFNSTGIDTAG